MAVYVSNSSLDEVKGHILGRKPLPSLQQVFFAIRLEESPKRVKLGPSPKTADAEISALLTWETNGDGDKKKVVV